MQWLESAFALRLCTVQMEEIRRLDLAGHDDFNAGDSSLSGCGLCCSWLAGRPLSPLLCSEHSSLPCGAVLGVPLLPRLPLRSRFDSRSAAAESASRSDRRAPAVVQPVQISYMIASLFTLLAVFLSVREISKHLMNYRQVAPLAAATLATRQIARHVAATCRPRPRHPLPPNCERWSPLRRAWKRHMHTCTMPAATTCCPRRWECVPSAGSCTRSAFRAAWVARALHGSQRCNGT